MVNRKEIVVIVLIVALFVGMWMVVSSLDVKEHDTQTQMVHDAVKNAAITCYAVEGAYPSNLDYLKDNYGLTYDQKRYMVNYSAFATNLFPEIFVVEITGAS